MIEAIGFLGSLPIRKTLLQLEFKVPVFSVFGGVLTFFLLAPATLELEEGARVTLVIVIFFSPQC